MKIFDVHLHIGHLNEKVYPKNKLEVLQGELECGLVSSASAGTVSQDFGNRDNFKFTRSQKDFKGLIWINPYDPRWEKNAKKYAYEAVGIKLHPVIDRWRVKLDFMKPVLDFAVREKLPLFIHTDNDRCQAEKFIEAAKYIKSLPLVLYHSQPYLQSVALAKVRTNVYLETSGKNADKMISKALKEKLSEKILFGSDMMFHENTNDADNLLHWQGVVKNIISFVPPEERQKVFYSNAERLIKKYGKRTSGLLLHRLLPKTISRKTT